MLPPFSRYSQFLLCELVTAPGATRSERRVGIVGAGFAGLACAHELVSAGYEVDLFEARDRLGGRVLTLHDFTRHRAVEGGGELIGANHPLWIKFARHFKLDLVKSGLLDEDVPKVAVLDGKLISDPSELKQLEDEVGRGYQHLAGDARAAVWEEPWCSSEADRLDNDSLAQHIAMMETTDRAKRAIFTEFANDMACDPCRMNYLALLCVIKAHGVERYWTDTDAFRCAGGSQTLASRLADVIGEKRIHVDRPVIEISAQNEVVHVKTKDGCVSIFDDVVLAVPPSVWKDIRINPPLPEGFSPQMGGAVKALAHLTDRFWPPNQAIESISDTFLGDTWDSAGREPAGNDPVLISFAGGPASEVAHGFPRTERQRRYVDAWAQVLPGFGEHLANFRFIDWIEDRWTLAGYSFPAPGAFLHQARILHHGIGRLHFAGEHASFGFMGFMEGGLQSGVALANRLARRDGILAQ